MIVNSLVIFIFLLTHSVDDWIIVSIKVYLCLVVLIMIVQVILCAAALIGFAADEAAGYVNPTRFPRLRWCLDRMATLASG